MPEGEQPQQAYDPWAVLGLKPGASPHDLRVRYHELLELYHPDYVKAGAEPDVQKWADVDRAYQLTTKAPTLDRRYRNLISDTQAVYYRFLPEWMAKNLDEMPRWWSWIRWRVPKATFVMLVLFALYFTGRIWANHPRMGKLLLMALVSDVLFHTSIFPIMFTVLCATLLFAGNDTMDMAWLTSPKEFLRRPLQY